MPLASERPARSAAAEQSAAGQAGPRAIKAVGLSAAALIAAVCSATVADSDLWGHLRFGLDILETRRLPFEDPYSFTQDLPWVNHEWLSELAMGLAWTAGGPAGLVLLKGALVATALFLVWRTLSAIDLGPRMMLVAFAAAGVAPIARTLRPQLWTLLFLVVLCRTLLSGRSRAWLPVLIGAWANFHGGWIVGFGVLCAWTAGEVLQQRSIRTDQVVVPAAGLLATLANPYGWGLWQFLANTVRMGRDITEWQPLWNSPPIDSVPWVITIGLVVWMFRRLPAGDRWSRGLVLLMLAYSAARVIRIAPLFVACAALLLAAAFAARWPNRARPLVRTREDAVVAGALAAVVFGAALWMWSRTLTCITVETPRAADAAAARLLMSAPPGRVVTFFDWGEYALWHLGPELRVSMDGRRETVYSDARLAEHGAILNGEPAGFETLAAWRPEYVWLPASSGRTREWLAAQGYRIEHASGRSFVAVRPDLPRLQPTPMNEAAARCFPG
jgi:hypothetical protein